MTLKKIILPGIVAGIAMLIVGMGVNWLVGFVLPTVAAEYQNPALFRPWSDPLMSLIFIEPFVLGLVLAWAWDKTKQLFKATSIWKRGINFGLAYFLITIPGMFISYSTFPVSLMMIISWSVSGFLQAVVAGWVFAKMAK